MFLVRILLSIIILTLFSSTSWSEIVITDWQEEVSLTRTGKESKVSIKAKVEKLKKGTYHNGFTIIFDKKKDIQINKVQFDNRVARYSFKNNQLKVNFLSKKVNGQFLSINYNYLETSKKIDPYLRQEFVNIPSWVKNANSISSLTFPANLEVVSFNKNLKRNGNQLIYQGKVPESGISELIKLTPKSSTWNVNVKSTINSNNALIGLEAKVPIYFFNGGQRGENNYTSSNPEFKNSEQEGDYYNFKYGKLNTNNVEISTSSKVHTGSLNRQAVNRNPNNYLKVNNDDWFLLSDITTKISSNVKYQGLPLYAKIGQFVHDYIKYDKSYVGKLLDTKTILSKKRGVCVEYAKLFNDLARMSGIPSIIINGAAKGEYDKFEGHSWNMIYYNNKWIQVDPTWNLMSGNVSSSHIYFYDNNTKAIEAKWVTRKGTNIEVDLNTDFEISAQ